MDQLTSDLTDALQVGRAVVGMRLLETWNNWASGGSGWIVLSGWCFLGISRVGVVNSVGRANSMVRPLLG